MSQAFFSFLTGLFYTSMFFFLCLFSVIGAKFLLFYYFSQKNVKRTPKPQHKKKPKTPQPSISKPIKSIEINPDEIDRIYVKKSS